jgi:formate dehydrogenase subunit gamma
MQTSNFYPKDSHEARALSIAMSMKDMPGALLPILHEIQHSLGFVPPETVPVIADVLNLSRAEVHGVVSYYHHFRSTAPGRHVVQICRAEACQSMNGDALASYAEKRLGCSYHETTADGQFSLEAVYCLGLCAQSPAIMIGDQLHAKVTPQKLDALLTACAGVAA